MREQESKEQEAEVEPKRSTTMKKSMAAKANFHHQFEVKQIMANSFYCP